MACQYDIQAFMYELGISMVEMSEFYAEYIKEIDIQITDLSKALSDSNWEKTRLNLHNIRGLSSSYKVSDVYEEALKLSHCLKLQDYGSLKEDFPALLETWERARLTLTAYFSSSFASS